MRDLTKVFCHKNYIIGEIDERLYGSFAEHMGRVIYSGIYEPGHKDADDDGFRRDVLEKVRDMNVTTVRYPGGNFVSGYQWEDGVGPMEDRPKRLELAWRSIETNEFGTNEFMKWAKKANVDPIFTVNLGTRGLAEAVQYLEYCNFPGGTKYSDMRKGHGVEEPYGIKLWCLGNEMDGKWQIGHKTAEEYGRLAAETGKAMKTVDPEIQLIVCGSSLSTMDTYPEWDMKVLEETYEVADYLALHQYYGGQEKGTQEFLAQSLDMEEYIKTIRSAVQVVKAKKRSTRDMKLSVDEWGVWAVPSETVNKEVEEEPWQVAPAISEQIYSMEDALLFASMQMVMLRNADIIKIACQSLITNISSCIMTEKGGETWLQTIFYPFRYIAKYAKGVVMNTPNKGPTYDGKQIKNVPYVDSLVIWNEKEGELVIFAVNRSSEEAPFEVEFQGFVWNHVEEAIVLFSSDIKMTNKDNHMAVVPQKFETVEVENQCCKTRLKPLSFTMIRLR